MIEKIGQINNQEKERLSKIADELDILQKEAIKRLNIKAEVIPYVNWIVEDLRKGDLHTAKVNYANQSDKYGSFKEIKKFLEENGIAESYESMMKGIQ